METTKLIKKFEDFVETNYLNDVMKVASKGGKSLEIDFLELTKYDPKIADMLLDEPDEVIKAAELALTNFDLPADHKPIKVRLTNLSEEQKVFIRNIRAEHLNKMLMIEGTVRQKSDVRPQVTAARFECPSCGNILNVLQLDNKFKEPTRCGCGRKGKFRLLSKELVDAQGIVLEEATKDLDGGEQPKRMNVLLKDDLVSPISERRTNPGSSIRINGAVKEVPIILRSGGQSTKFDLIIEANNVEALEEDYTNIEISTEEEEEIMELAKDKQLNLKLINSLAPGIYGHDRIKEALLMQFVGGVKKERPDGVPTRGDIHILLIGDPGAGKCITGNTKIMLENGDIIPIKTFFDKNMSYSVDEYTPEQVSDNIFSINEKGLNSIHTPVKFFRRKAPKKLLKIITQTGNELIITREHPLFTSNNGIIFSKEARDFNEKEYLALPSKIDIEGSLQDIPRDIIKSNANNKVKYKIKELLDPDFARLLGYLMGDGYVLLRETTGVISFTNSDKELLDDFKNLIKKVFDLDVCISKKKDSSSLVYYISSIEIFRILEKMVPSIAKRSGEQEIPSIIKKSPDCVLKEYIKGLFDSEGHIRNHRREIEFSSKSMDLIFDLKYLLLRFGIISQVTSSIKWATNTMAKIKRRYYRLRISGEDIIKYHDEIGFTSSKKLSKLEHMCFNVGNLNTNLKIVPNLKELLKILRKKYNFTQSSFNIPRSTYQHYERGDRFPSYAKLYEICTAYNSLGVDDPLIEVLNQISKADVFWDKIKSVEEIDSNDEYVYDLEIEKVHNFVANGAIVHNSMLLKRAAVVAPKARYVSGKGVSGAGLTASVVRDEFLSGWSLEAGALVLANRGVVMIDELDKMSSDDRDAMHEGLEQQSISISKANIQATLHCETTVLAAANPKFGRFDPYETIAKQIDLPPTLINRFDLIFTIKDLPDEEKDEKMADFMLHLHKSPGDQEADIETELLRKYLVFCKQRMKPRLTTEAVKELKEYYIKMRGSGGMEEGGVKSIPISARQLEALVRLSESAAKIRLSDEVKRQDAKKAIGLLHYCLEQVGLDPETGKIDIDRITTGITTSERGKIMAIREIINTLEEKHGKIIPIDDIISQAGERGISEDDVDEAIQKLKRTGDIYQPKPNTVSKI